MTNVYSDIIKNFDSLSKEKQPINNGKLYLKKDFDKNACERLYSNLNNDLIKSYIKAKDIKNLTPIVTNKGLLRI